MLVCFVNQVPLIGKVIWYLSLTAWLIYITRYIEIKNKLIMGEKGEMVFRNMYKGYNLREVGSRVGSGDDWGWGSFGGKMETTVLE